jgi:hypothetical protein
MEELGQLNLLMDLFGEKATGKTKVPGDIGETLFRNLLEKNNQSLGETGWRRSLYEDSLKSSAQQAEDGRLAKLDQGVRQLGIPIGQLRLPKSAVPQLTKLLEAQGLGTEKIQTLIASVTDRDGSLRLDRLMAKLEAIRKETKSDEDRKVINAKDIPRLGEALLAMGMGVGQVKEVIEKSLNQKGEVALDRLSGFLDKLIPGQSGKALLERYSIEANLKAAQKGSADSEVKQMVKDFTEAASQDVQKKVKEEIGQLLREKGVPPQEVKSFLETLTVGYGRTLSKKAETGQTGAEKAEGDASAKAVMEKVVLRTEAKRTSDEWRDKILSILQKEQGVPKQGLERQWFHQEALARTSGGEALKTIEQKLAAIQTEGVRIPEAKTRTGLDAGQAIPAGAEKKTQADGKPTLSFKEVLPGEGTAVRLQREGAEMTSIHTGKNAVALPDPLPKVLDKMVWMAQSGEQKGTIHISPPELGRLDLDVVIKQGHLQANLSAENPQVKEIIEANMGQLKQHLTDLGFVVDRFSVMVGLEDRSFAREQGRASGQGRGRSGGRHASRESVAAIEDTVRRDPVPGLSQVDMRV